MADKNQCDGCKSGLPIDHLGVHNDEHGLPVMACQSHRYATATPPADAAREAVAVPECFLALYRAALGLTHGEDWNNGTAASFHRIPLIDATGRCAELLAASGRNGGA